MKKIFVSLVYLLSLLEAHEIKAVKGESFIQIDELNITLKAGNSVNVSYGKVCFLHGSEDATIVVDGIFTLNQKSLKRKNKGCIQLKNQEETKSEGLASTFEISHETRRAGVSKPSKRPKKPGPKTTTVKKTFYDNGQIEYETPYINGKKEGVEKHYRKNGCLLYETPYRNDQAEGIQKMYFCYDSVKPSLIKETPIKNGKVEGIVKAYHTNGRLSRETPYRNGEREGVEKRYYSYDGSIQKETPYRNGVREGMEKWYFGDGTVFEEIPYRNGKREGVRKEYDRNGKLIGKTFYKNGEVVGEPKVY